MKKLFRKRSVIFLKNTRLQNYSNNIINPLISQMRPLEHILFYEELCSQSKKFEFDSDLNKFNFSKLNFKCFDSANVHSKKDSTKNIALAKYRKQKMKVSKGSKSLKKKIKILSKTK